ncbi:MAG: hypothetical protein ACFFBD_24275 [Candidatus Hodarchaeota archaeon]
MKTIREEITENDRPLVKEAYLSQKNTGKPLILQGINLVIGAFSFMLIFHSVVAVIIGGMIYSAINTMSSNLFVPLFLILLVTLFLILGEFIAIIWLIRVKKTAPAFLERLNKHLKGTDL